MAGAREPGGGARGAITPPPNFLSEGDEYACAPRKFWQSLGISTCLPPPPKKKIVPAPLDHGHLTPPVMILRSQQWHESDCISLEAAKWSLRDTVHVYLPARPNASIQSFLWLVCPISTAP